MIDEIRGSFNFIWNGIKDIDPLGELDETDCTLLSLWTWISAEKDRLTGHPKANSDLAFWLLFAKRHHPLSKGAAN